jgi:hypothetical protein
MWSSCLLDLVSGYFQKGLLNILYAFLVSPILVTCPAHHSLLDFTDVIYINYDISCYVTCSFPSSFGPNIFLSTLFSSGQRGMGRHTFGDHNRPVGHILRRRRRGGGGDKEINMPVSYFI